MEARVSFTSLPHPAERPSITYRKLSGQSEVSTIVDSAAVAAFTDGSSKNGNNRCCLLRHWDPPHQLKRNLSWPSTVRYIRPSSMQLRAYLTMNNKNDIWNITDNPTLAIVSNNQSSLTAIGRRGSVNPMVNDIHNNYRSLVNKGLMINFYWCRSHTGIPGNEIADQLAKEATALNTAVVYDRFPLTLAKYEVRKNTFESWNTRYLSAENGQHTKKFIEDVYSATRLFSKVKPTFGTTQMVTGHSFAKNFLNKINRSPTIECFCDGITTQTVLHLLYDCSRFSTEREAFCGHCTLLNIDPKDTSSLPLHILICESFRDLCEVIVDEIENFNG